MDNLTHKTIWESLKRHQARIAPLTMRELFANDKTRFKTFSLEAADLLLDYSKNRFTKETLRLLCKLANAVNLRAQINDLYNGKVVNHTENRAALHIALRNPSRIFSDSNHQNIADEILASQDRVKKLSREIRERAYTGFSRKPIANIVNIGIGGSDLGPALVTEALSPYKAESIHCYFISTIDSVHINQTLARLNPETTLFIIASKSFTTQETLHNAEFAKSWLLQADPSKTALKKQMFAITGFSQRAKNFGIAEKNILPVWDWIGGRYSLWSNIGLPIIIAVGEDHFKQFLAGANAMDKHFYEAPFSKNMPVILALVGIWYNNFFDTRTHAVIPYTQLLQRFPAYLQQLEMESNGKSVTRFGNPINYNTAPIVWGATGTNGQHAFHQLLHQGTRLIPVDFIVATNGHYAPEKHQEILFANCLAQSSALMQGKTSEEVINELKKQGVDEITAKKLAPHKVIPGNKPSNTIIMPQLTPYTLGALIALYEHKVFTQSVIWDINPFDQWGVEMGKTLNEKILQDMSEDNQQDTHDNSTSQLIKYYKTKSKQHA